MTIAFSLKMRLLKNEVQLIYNVVLVSDAQQSDPVIHVLTLCDRIDCSLLGSSAHGISQARRLEWVAISSSRGSSQQGLKLYLLYWQTDSLPLSYGCDLMEKPIYIFCSYSFPLPMGYEVLFPVP